MFAKFRVDQFCGEFQQFCSKVRFITHAFGYVSMNPLFWFVSFGRKQSSKNSFRHFSVLPQLLASSLLRENCATIQSSISYAITFLLLPVSQDLRLDQQSQRQLFSVFYIFASTYLKMKIIQRRQNRNHKIAIIADWFIFSSLIFCRVDSSRISIWSF